MDANVDTPRSAAPGWSTTWISPAGRRLPPVPPYPRAGSTASVKPRSIDKR
jgi:hypothetical protein